MSSDDDRQTPTLASAMMRAVEARLYDVHVCVPARVESYDESARKISAQPLIHRGVIDEGGDRVAERPAVIQEIPVVFPGSGGVRVKFPIAVGDVVLLLFSGQSLDRWLVRGGEVDPEDDRRHAESDAIAIPGLQPFSGTGAAGNGSPMIEFTTGGQIHAGGSAALATKADLDALKSAISGAAVLAGDGGATFKANIMSALATWPTGTTTLKGA